MTITLRGRVVAFVLLLLAAFAVGIATGPYCWNGSGYGRCMSR